MIRFASKSAWMDSTMTEQPQDLRTIRETNERLRSMIESQEVIRDKFWLGGVVTYLYKSHLGHSYFTNDPVVFPNALFEMDWHYDRKTPDEL
jgi:hypothetical protein